MTEAERQALELEVAAMDFMDTSVNVLEMREKLSKRMTLPGFEIEESVLDYVPTDTDIYLTLPDGRYENQIWTDIPLREKEVKHFADFEEWLSKNKLTLPAGFDQGPQGIAMLTNRDF